MAKGVPSTVLPTLRSSINPIRDFRCLMAFLRIVRSERPDLLHAHSSKAGMIARMAGYLQRLPCLYTVHGWGFWGGSYSTSEHAGVLGGTGFFTHCGYGLPICFQR
ncbi:MAG: glycosyltransferase [Burkholderiales bacterium]|nr:glycosyltransferase [Burkholderiales bacterium]